MKSFTHYCLITIMTAFMLSGCKKDSVHPEPTLIPLIVSFNLYQIQSGDSIIAGTASLDQTLEDKAKITLKLAAEYRLSSGSYSVTMHHFGGDAANALSSNVGSIPANSTSWQSDVLKQVGTNTSFAFPDLYSRMPNYIRISNGSTEVAVGKWVLIPE